MQPKQINGHKRGLLERLDNEGIVCAEGFLFEIERRGYMASGEFVPKVVLDHAEALTNLHRDFQNAGSDVVQAFTYNGHREKMRVIGEEHLLEPLNREALRLAKRVADSPWPDGAQPDLLAGNISNSNLWNPDDPDSQREVRAMFDEMVKWAAEEGADFIIGETFYYAGEAYCALEAIQASGLPAVITIAPMAENIMRDGLGIVETCKELERRGADVVGMNCFRGPDTMMPYIRQIRQEVSCHMAALPVAFRTTEQHPTFFNLPDGNGCTCPSPHGRPFPTALEPMSINRYEVRAFAEEAWNLGVKYLGVCCGAVPVYIREVAEAMGRTPRASAYRERIENHFMYGSNERLPDHITAYGDKA